MEKQSRNRNYGLPPEEVNELIKKYQESEDNTAQSELVENYTKLVESLAYRYSRGQSHHEDLVQVGMLGLLGAIRRFDTSFERRFEVFLVPAAFVPVSLYPSAMPCKEPLRDWLNQQPQRTPGLQKSPDYNFRNRPLR